MGRWLLACGMLVCFAEAAAAQGGGRVEGTVTAEESGEPLPGVLVLVEGSNRSALTDARGTYRLSAVGAGPATIVTRFLGREPQEAQVTVSPDSPVRADFRLKAAALQLNEVVVSASREQEKRMEIPVAIGVVDGAALRATQPAHPSEVMNRIAGVLVPVTGGEGHMAAIRQPITTDPVYLYLEDGVPSRSTGFFNHNALYEINLPQADRVEVSKGPATALYGSDAIGGVVNVFTRPPSARPEAEVSLDGGAYKWGRMLATASNTWGRAGIRADLNLTRTDGWREATDYTRQSGTLRWDQMLGATARVKTVATYSHIDQRTAGTSAISLADFQSNPTVNYTPISLRQVEALRLSADYEQEGAGHSVSITPYARYDWMRLIPNWTLTYDPQDYTTQNKSLGLLAKYRRDFAPLRARVIVGTDVDLSPGGQVENQIAVTRQGSVFTSYTAGATTYDYDVTFHGISPYAQVELSPVSPLRIDLGLRLDETGYAYTNHLSELQTGRWRRPADTTVSYSHVSPKLGATYAVAPQLNLFVSWRHGFRAPSQGQLFRQGSALNTVGLQPVKANDYEGGVRGRVVNRIDYDVTVYSLIKSDDILSYTLADGSTEATNAGRTSHRGLEVALGLQLVEPLRVDVAYSYARHRYDDWHPRFDVDLSGKEMQSAPRELGNLAVTWAPAQWRGAQASLQWSRLGSYWMDQDNTHQYPGHNLINLRASTPAWHGVAVSARLMNLTDRRYAELSSYTAARGEEYAPGMPRRLYVTMQYHLQ
jgi:outer membrane receptor protein involved in Fe transport